MKKNYFLVWLIIISCALCASCRQDDVEILDGEIVFRLKDAEGKPLTGMQSFRFGESVTYDLETRFASYIDLDAPAKWLVEAVPSAGTCKISAPSMEDAEAAMSGKITFHIKSQAGRTSTVTVEVGAIENDIVLTLNEAEATTETQYLAYEQVKKYYFTSSNVKDLSLTPPQGWTATYTSGDTFFTLTAPGLATPDFENKGTLEITPVSYRGTIGEKISMEVELAEYTPSIIFTQESHTLASSASKDIEFTAASVTSLEIVSKPAGWNVTADLEGGKLSVAAPATADLLTVKGGGYIVVKATNADAPEGSISEKYQVFVRLNVNGIYSAADFEAFSKAFQTNGSLDTYTYQNEIALLADIDLSQSENQVFVPGTFNKVFNGYNNTITLGIEVKKVGSTVETGIFQTLDASAAVKNLVIDGTISSTLTDAQYLAGLATYNNGAPVTNVKTKIDFTYTPSSFKTIGWYGSIAARTKGALYTGCESSGSIILVNGFILNFGGLVGDVLESPFDVGTEDRSQMVRFKQCKNTGDISATAVGSNPGNPRFGGILGAADNFMVEYTEVTNTGNITVNIGATNTNQIHSVGGIAGNSYGFFTNCVNRGNMSFTEASSNRRYGGIVGGVGSTAGKTAGYYLRMTDCTNYGNMSHTSPLAGGLSGIVENCNGNAIFTRCVNNGRMSNPQTAESVAHDKNPSQYSGLVSFIKGGTFNDCHNHGDIYGLARDRMAGLVGRCQNGEGNILFNNCSNTGAITLLMHPNNTIKNVSAAGIAVFDANKNANFSITFQSCSNTGVINAQIFPAPTVTGERRVFHIVSMSPQLSNINSPLFDGVTLDDSTKAYQISTSGLIQTDLK